MSGFTYNPAIEKQLERSHGMLTVLATYANAGAEHAVATAPTGHPHRGVHYKDSIFAVAGIDERGPVGVVGSADFFAAGIEFGSVNNPAYAPLRRGVESTGLKVTDRGKSAHS